MAPMFCTKLFPWGKSGKKNKENSNRPALDTVFPVPQDEGEACPYWTHVQCNPPSGSAPSSRPHTPTQAPLLPPPNYPVSPVHHQPAPRSPVSHRRAAHHRNHQVKRGGEAGFYNTYNYNSPYNSPGPNSPVGQGSPVHFTPIHHNSSASSHGSPVHSISGYNSPPSHHTAGHHNQGYGPLHNQAYPGQHNQAYTNHHNQGYPNHPNQGYGSPHASGYNTPAHQTSGYNSPHASGFNSPVPHASGYNTPSHPSGYNSPAHYTSGCNSPVPHASGYNSPAHHTSGYNSPHASGYNSPHASGLNSPVPHSSGYNSPVQGLSGGSVGGHHRGYILESNYCQPLPPPPPQRPPPPLPGLEGSGLKGGASCSSSRSTSPANNNTAAGGSFIPQPRGHAARASLNEKHVKGSGASNLARTSLRAPSSQTSPNHVVQNHAQNHVTPASSPYHTPVSQPKHKDSMLDKFKLFNHKEKDARNKTTSSSGVSKRTSSSSGFSSARSERSDSSTSVCSDARPPPLPPHQSLPVSTSSSSSDQASHTDIQGAAVIQAKPQGLRGIRSKFSKSSGKEGKESPKSSRKEKEREERGSPRGGHKAHRGDSRERGSSGGSKKTGGEKLTLELDSGSIASRPRQPPPQHHPPPPPVALIPRPEASLAHSTDHHYHHHPPALPPKERDPPPPPAPPQYLDPPPPPALPQGEEGPASTPGSPVPCNGPGTGIPKPTAHVKGQTKATPPPAQVPSPNVNTPHQTKDYNNKMVRHAQGSASSGKHSSRGGSGTQTIEAVQAPQEPRDPKGSLPRQKQLGRREDQGGGISVALVSPMPSSRDRLEPTTPSECPSTISDASLSNNSTSSTSSSVIYKPTSSEDESLSHYKGHIAMVDERGEGEDGDEVILNIKPMQPLIRASQYGYMRGLGLHHTRTVPPSLHVSRLALQDAANTVPQKGMRLGPHMKRPPPGGPQIIDTDYSDLESVDLTNGYMSDGDVLRTVGYKGCAPPSELDGYLSEGGASLYAHRLTQRFREGMRQVHESMNKVQHFIQDDSFDDSSSLSSGVSDTLNEMSAEDVLSSSLSDHPAYPKSRGVKEVGLKLPVGLSGAGRRVGGASGDPSGSYKVVSSRAHVKKTESSQQTDNSAFKQISNTQWKKYVENGKGSLDRTGREVQRGSEGSGSSTAVVRRVDHKKGSAGSPQSAGPPGLNGAGRKMEKKGTSGERRTDRSGREKGTSSGAPQVNGDSKKLQNPKMAPGNFGYGNKRATSSSGVSSKTSGSKGVRDGKELVEGTSVGAHHDASSHSLERPRTKLKVSGGTQTTSDLNYMSSGVHSDGEYSSGSLGRKYQLKSYSLNGPVAAQLSQSVRERIMQSPYGKVHVGPGGEYAQYPPPSSPYFRERSPRIKPTDGSLSDSPYSNYAELQYAGSPYGSPYSWVSRSNYAGSVASAPTRGVGGSLTEAESLESVSSSASSIAAQLQARANSLTQARLLMHQREMSSSPSPRLARSNSVRSTKSEKLYGSGTGGGREGYHASQPTSPTPPMAARLPISPLNTARGSPYYSTVIPRTGGKDDECHGSSLSLVSSSSSLYSSQEEKQAHEIRKLRRDLADAQDKVGTLTNQLTTNAHVVAAFEQSLTNMTNRLQQLTASSEQKESELSELRHTIDALRQQSIEAGLTVACLQSTSPSPNTTATICSPSRHHHHHHHHHHHSPTNLASCSVLNVATSPGSRSASPDKSGLDVARRHTFTGNCKDLVPVACEFGDAGGKLVRGTSVESVSSISSACSATSHTSNQDRSDGSKSGKKKGWLRSSFSKAFSRGHKKGSKGGGVGGSVSDMEGWERSGGDSSAPSSPQLNRTNGSSVSDVECLSTTSAGGLEPKVEEVEVLKYQLREKDMVLTDIRLEALTSAHQLESLKETISKMRNEMVCLKQDNDRLHRMVSSKSLNSSQSSLPASDLADQRLSLGEDIMLPDVADVILIDPSDKDGKRVSIAVFLGCHGDYEKYINPADGMSSSECIIGAISVSGKTKWDMLDNLVKRIFKEYILRVDPVSNLGLSAESILSYHIGEVARGREPHSPELLPCGYLVGEVTTVNLTLKGAIINQVDALAFETLIPKSVVQRYVSLLTEHRRIILCGPSGTGKTYLAHKLAEYLVTRMAKDPSPGHVATFNVDHKTGKDLGAYLSHISEQCETNSSDLPLVIILDNLHHAGALTEVFNGFLSAKYTQCPFIIGTMNQTTSCSTTNLQLHHNFRWVLIANHMEPVKGLVGRVARRRLTQVEVEAGSRLPRLQHVLDWLPRCWTHINKFLETHSSSDFTIGPRLFLSCPGSLEGSQVWFIDLWNYSLVPYLVEAVREGLQIYGKRSTWEDPSTWLRETYPWGSGREGGPQALLSLRPEDVGYDTLPPAPPSPAQEQDTQPESDPLLSMLMRLQEAANYTSPQQDSDSASLENLENPLESSI